MLDLGCAPGSWTKFAAQRVGSSMYIQMCVHALVDVSLCSV